MTTLTAVEIRSASAYTSLEYDSTILIDVHSSILDNFACDMYEYPAKRYISANGM